MARDRRRRAAGALRRSLRRAPGPVALATFAVLGMGVSVYLTTVHYAGVPLVWSTTGVVDCAAVTTSAYSVIPGTSVPITVLGVVWFLGSGALAGAALIASVTGREEPRWLRGSHALLGVTGLVAALYLVYVEAVRLHRLCEWCTAVHLLVFATLLVALARLQHVPPSGARPCAERGGHAGPIGDAPGGAAVDGHPEQLAEDQAVRHPGAGAPQALDVHLSQRRAGGLVPDGPHEE